MASAAAATATATAAAPAWSRLPLEILIRFLTFARDEELPTASRVSKAWREAAEDDAQWEFRCARRWAKRANVVVGQLFKAAKFNEATLARLSVKDMKQILTQRRVDCSRFIEKSEYRKALMQSEATVRIPAPFPALGGKWRASYVYEKLDATSRAITRNELTDMEWHFFFKENPHAFSSKGRFQSNGYLMMNPWPMQEPEPPGLTWVLTYLDGRAGGERVAQVQVHHFPPHVFSRNADGSWRMENHYVIFFQVCPNLQQNIAAWLKRRGRGDEGDFAEFVSEGRQQ